MSAKYWITGSNLLYYWDGVSWTSQTLPSGVGRLWGIAGIDDLNIFAVGQDTTSWYTSNCNPVFLWTNDGGTTWNSEATQIAIDIPVNTGYTFLGLHVFGVNNVWICGHEFFSSQDYYLWHWNGSTFTNKAGIIDPHLTFLWGDNANEIYISSPAPNPSTDDYVLWDGVSANWPNDITGITKGGVITGLNSTDVYLIDNVNPHVLAQGYHGGSWSTYTMKTGFYTSAEGDYLSKNMDIDEWGNIYVAAYDTTAVAHQVAIGKLSTGFYYTTLGASANLTSNVFAASPTDACCVYTKSGGLDQSTWFFNGFSWSAGPDITTMARCFSIYGYVEQVTEATGTRDDLEINVGTARNVFLKIHGLEPIYWQWNSRGEPTEGYDRSILTCLKPPAEFSVGLNLAEGLPDVSAMTFKFDDVKDSDSTYYFAKLFAPARWDDNPHCRSSKTIKAEDDSFFVIDATTMPDSGIAYIGNETISYTSKHTAAAPKFHRLDGIERDLYPCITDVSVGKHYQFPTTESALSKMAIGTVPFTLIGRQVALYVVTWNKDLGKWNYEDDALLVWTGRVSDMVQYDGKEQTWSLSCQSLVNDFNTKIVNYNRKTELAKLINLSGYDKYLRQFTIYVKNLDNVILSSLKIDLDPRADTAWGWLNSINSILQNPNTTWEGNNPVTVYISFAITNGRTEIYVRTTTTAARKVKFTYDYSQHLFQALGFEVDENNFFELSTDVETEDPDYSQRWETRYFSKNEAYEAYHPVNPLETDNRLYVVTAGNLLDDQGDGPENVAAVRMKKVKIGKETVDLYYRYGDKILDADVGGTYLWILAPDLNYDQYYPRDFFGYRRQDEPTIIENILIPYPDVLDDPADTEEFGSLRKRGPFEILLMILTSTGSKNYNGDYDLLPFDYGIGMHQALFDFESFHEADSLIVNSKLAYRYFYPIENKTVRDLIKAECILFGFAISWIDGKFKVIQTMPPPTDKVEKIIDETNIIDPYYQPQFEQSTNIVINQYDCYLRFNSLSSKFEAPIVVSDVDSIKSLDQSRPVKIEHKGIKHMATLEEFNELLDNQLLGRYLRFPMPTLSGVPLAPTEINQVFVGEVIQFISNKCPDPFGSGTKDTNSYALLVNLSWNYVTWIGSATFILLAQAQSYGESMAAAAINDLDASNGGWSSSSYQMTLERWTYGRENEDPKDGERFRANDYIRIVERAPADPDNPQSWGPFEVAKNFEADGTDILTLATGTTLTGWDNTKEYIIMPADYTEVAEDQKTDIFIADISELIESGRFGYLIG